MVVVVLQTIPLQKESFVLDVDVPSHDDDVDNNTSNVSSDVLSADTSTGGGTLITGKEMTVADNVEGEYPPLPDN